MPAPDVTPDLPPRTWRVILALLGRLPQGPLSRSFGRIADIPIPPPLRRHVLGAFARAVGVDVSEAERPLEAYGSLNEFFVRRLRPGVRSWPERPDAVASPVDGVLGQLGEIHGGRLLQAKGRWYSAAQLLASEEEARRFDGGRFLTIYLSPRHYHRIHAPVGGSIPAAVHVPGLLYPVNDPAVTHIPELFARNERLLCYIDAEVGRVAVVAVGAYNVGRISASFDPSWQAPMGRGTWVTNRAGAQLDTHAYSPPVPVRLGDEIMAFHLGSTVVLLLEPGSPPLRADLRPGAHVRLGEQICEER